ncbi:MAG: DEAD/DEAH box helicase [Lautropia sp.]|nr:DEAD/DEAH box helicase [Lautropia sp.]
MPLTQAPAPGSRALIRDEEWLIQRADACEHGGWRLSCIGVSETVRNRVALFLSVLEQVTLIDPAKTELVFDRSPAFVEGRLAIEARLRQSAVQGESLVLGHHGVMDVMPFQLEPTLRVLQQLRPRLLIADTVGLGKTLEAGILSAELMRRGRVRRMLVVSTKSMMRQFQEEFWNRFTIALTRLDSARIQRIRREIPANHNPFNYFDRSIISVDTLKRDSEYRHYLENSWWDLIIIDEAHNVSYKGNRTQSNRLARLLAQRSDALILLTATPHNGRKESFASLVEMLDPTAIPPNAEYERAQVEHLFIRRFKNDVRDQMKKGFPDRRVYKLQAVASLAEERAFSLLAGIKKRDAQSGEREGGRQREGAILFSTILEKALFSSPDACLKTVDERIRRLEKRDAVHPDLEPLREFRGCVAGIGVADFSKLNHLVRLLKGEGLAGEWGHAGHESRPDTHELVQKSHDPSAWQWDGRVSDDRLVIFTERVDTLRYLEKQLPAALNLKKDAVAVLHGQMADEDIQSVVEDFGRTHSPLRLLIASDVASEGLNLHYRAHRLIHFDIPWSLMVFQQRNGRVDRYGQSRPPKIGYLYTTPEQETIRGDVRYLEILVEKDDQAAKNIGDPSAFMGLHDEQAEVEKVAVDMQNGKPFAEFEAELDAENDDPFSALLEGTGNDEAASAARSAQKARVSDMVAQENESGSASAHAVTHGNAREGVVSSVELPSLFASHFDYASAGLQCLHVQNPRLQHAVRFDKNTQTVSFQPGEDLQHVLERELADEMWPKDNTFALSANRAQIEKAVAASRDGDAWPAVQYLWPLHPVLQWLDYKLMANFGRQRAPVLRVAQGLQPDETIVLVLGQIPNRRGQAMVAEWMGVQVSAAGKVQKVLGLMECLRMTHLDGESHRPVANDLDAPMPDVVRLQRALPEVIKAAEQHVRGVKREYDQKNDVRLKQELDKLSTQKQQHQKQLDLDLKGGLEQVRLSRQQRRQAEIDELFKQYRNWARETLELDDRPQLTVVAVLMA